MPRSTRSNWAPGSAAQAFNETLLAWICEYNGLTPCHVYRQIKGEEDTKALAEADKIVYDMGFELDEDTVRAKYGEGWSKKAAALPAPAPAPVQGPAPANFAEPGAAGGAGDEVDTLIANELAQWRPLLNPMVQPLQAFLEAAAQQGLTAAQVLERLPELLASMDDGALTTALARTAFAARAGFDAGFDEADA